MLAVCVVLTLAPPQEPQDAALAAVLAAEARRVEVMAACAPAVCSVMAMDAPGGGSGVVFDPAGFVLTNFHVVGQPDKGYKLPEPPEPPAEVIAQWKAANADAAAADEAKFVAGWKQQWRDEHLPRGKHHYKNKKVGLPDGQLYEGVVLGIDPGSDLAVLRLLPKSPGQQWPWCPLGDSDALLVGETVFAMGNPFLLATDFTPTVTFGIVSGTHRYQEGQGNRMLVYPDCIQVDAPVNPGNSGGPLFNERGEVVGINGRISIGDRGRVNVGVGFAIASNQIRNFLGDLLAGRHAEHGTLDMSAWYMTAPREETRRRGVFVQQMFKDSVVAAVGVSLGDELTEFNGTAIRSANQLATMVGVLPAGAWVTLGYKPALTDGGYGRERLATLRLSALDTGSSRDGSKDDARLASRENRRIATRSLLLPLAARAAAETRPAQGHGVTLVLTGKDGSTIRWTRRDEQLRLDVGSVALVRVDGQGGFAVQDGKARELTADERARLDRDWAANPLLWPPAERLQRLEQALLVGGVQVLGKPAYRYALPGDGEMETWLFADGEPAGCQLRDPLRRARIELHVAGDEVRVIADGNHEPGWQLSRSPFEPVDEALFRRP